MTVNRAPLLLASVLALSAAACSPPEAPPINQPPEPQATQLRDAIQAPLDKAHAVEDTLQQAAERQHEALFPAEE